MTQSTVHVQEFRLRTIIAMVLVSIAVSAAYPYMVLKMGIVPGMSIVSSLLTALFMMISLQRDFSARENNLIQTAATAAASAAFMCVVIAALEMLDIVVNPWTAFFWLTCSCTIGALMAVPMRRQYIEIEELPFPDGVATAETLLVLEDPTGPGRQKTIGLAVSGTVAMLFTWLRDGIGKIAGSFFTTPYMIGMEASLMLFGSGMLIGPRVCGWMLLSSLLTWGVLAPYLVDSGIAFEVATIFHKEAAYEAGVYYPVLMLWTMWPATVLLVAGGLTALVLRWRVVIQSFSSFAQVARVGAISTEFGFRPIAVGIILMTVLLCIVQLFGFGVPVHLTLVGVLLSFPLMLVGIRAAGETNIGPVSVMGSMMQIIFGVIAPGNISANMMASGTAGSIAAESQDLMFDFKAAKIIGSTPRSMTIAQLVGIPIGAAMVAIIQPILSQVYGYGGETGLPAPTAMKWKEFAELLTQGFDVLPASIIIAIGVAAIAGVLLAVCEFLAPKSKWVPSAMGIGIAMLLPSQMIVTMALGGVTAWAWKYFRSSESDTYAVPIASGLIAGEAIMAVVIPILMVTGVL